MKVEPPKTDDRKFSDIFDQLLEMLPHYTPEWKGTDGKEPGVALLKIYAYLAETVVNRFNQAPRKNFVAFLDMLGIKLLPAQPARVPLTFALAKGTEKEILIPPRTQAAADKTTDHEELPFETESNLLAIASRLKMAVSIDPDNDAIYQPPPGFLEGTVQGLTLTAYQLVSSPVAGATDFQLDHVTDLKEGDYLRLGERQQAEYVIIAKISGMIVTISDQLLNGHAAATPVAKVVSFSLFEGKNLQEHSLYLGHKELFNIKSTARFTIQVTHRPGTAAGVTPLNLSWEYWGEVTGEEGEEWRQFQTTDGTNGLSVDGSIELVKTVGGEIKEKDIYGVKNRWIRCRVMGPLAVDVLRRLPVLDNVTFLVKSSGENLQPNLTFNNDIPLDLSKPFSPFGKEPRMFDNFFLADQEVFSKKGAKITIDVGVAPRGIIGSPTAIEYGQESKLIKVFAIGTYGRLVEVEIDQAGGGEPEWKDHGFPPGSKLASGSTPSAIKYSPENAEFISVFARSENGHLVESLYNGIQWQWLDHGVPKEGLIAKFDPAALYVVPVPVPVINVMISEKALNTSSGSGTISVFVVGLDGQLYEFNRSTDILIGSWKEHIKLDGTSIDSSPFTISYVNSNELRIKVFVTEYGGKLYELDLNYGESTKNTAWADHGSPGSVISGVSVNSKPFADIEVGHLYVRVYVKGSDGNLWEFDSENEPEWTKKVNPDGVLFDSAPCGMQGKPGGSERTKIFMRGLDNSLYEFNDDTGWVSHQNPPNSKLSFSPFVLQGQEFLHVFSASDQASILERITNSTKLWNEYKDPSETALTPTLSWEYWNDKGWGVITGLADGTYNLLKDGRITFTMPDNIEETEIAGQKNYWLRARIVGGDYGRETFALALDVAKKRTAGTATQQLTSTKNTIRPPIITSLKIGYALETRQYPQKCLTCNNLDYIDQTDACRIADKHFPPFVQLDETNRTLYLGFEKPFAGGPIKIFLDAKELSYDEENKPKLAWSCSGKNEWRELDALDATEGLVRREILELIGPDDLAAQSRFGGYLCWLKGSLVEGAYEQLPVLAGIYPNTTWALQAATVKDEILRSGSGQAHQTATFLKVPVLPGEVVRVREILTEEEKQDLPLFEVKDEKGAVTETWVLWTEVLDFFDSRKVDRHYTLDRATGQLRFGDGENGMMPPEDKDNIKAFSYQYGGGAQGNVRAGEIKTLKSAVAGVDKVANPVAADGGADTATLEQMLEIGPAMISHRNRAVTVEDFQWLARDASRKVVKVKCLPNTRPGSNDMLQRESGWVTVIIVPDSREAQPQPSLELKSMVQRHLEVHSALTLSSARHLHVDGPHYTEIYVSVELFVASMDSASVVEREARRRLTAFFHPLTGGPEGKGWDFGRDVSASDVYALLEDITGLDHLENLRLSAGGSSGGDVVPIGENFLVAAGPQTVKLQLAKGV